MNPDCLTLDLKGLLPEDLNPQGTFFTNDFKIRIEDTPAFFRLAPPATPVIKLAMITLLVLAVFVGFWVVLHRVAPQVMTWPVRALIILIGIIGIGGALGGDLLRLRYLQRRGPILEFDKRTRRVRIDGGRREFAAADVLFVQSLTEWHGSYNRSLASELNLVTLAGGKRERHLLITAMDSRRKYFDYVLRPLAEKTGLRVLRVGRGRFGHGELTVEEMTRSASKADYCSLP
jgi:hypothetical protein